MGVESVLILFFGCLSAARAAFPYTHDSSYTYSQEAREIKKFTFTKLKGARYECTFDVDKSIRWKTAWIGISFSKGIEKVQYQDDAMWLRFADPDKKFYLFTNLRKVRRGHTYEIHYWAWFDGDTPTSSCTLHKQYKPPRNVSKPAALSNTTRIPPPPTSGATHSPSPASTSQQRRTPTSQQARTTTASNIPGADLPYETSLSVGSPWLSGGRPVVDAKCSLAVDRSYLPDTIQILVSMSKSVTVLNAWVGNLKDSAGDGTWHLFTNRYQTQKGKYEFTLQLSYDYGSTPPTGTCRSSLPGYGATTAGSLTAVSRTSTSPTPPTAQSSALDLPFETPMVTQMTSQGGVQQLDSKCSFAVDTEYQSNQVYVRVVLTTGTTDVTPYNGVLVDQAVDGTWYLFTNKDPLTSGKLAFTFQLTYTGSVQPTGICLSTLRPF